MYLSRDEMSISISEHCIVLKGWSWLSNALRPFQDLLCSLEFRYYEDVNMPITFCSDANFFRLEVLKRAWNLRLWTPSLKSLPEDWSWKNPSTSDGFEPANLGSRGEHVTPRPRKPTNMNLVFKHQSEVFFKIKTLFGWGIKWLI